MKNDEIVISPNLWFCILSFSLSSLPLPLSLFLSHTRSLSLTSHAHTAWVEGTLTHPLTHSLSHSLIHSLTSHFHAQSGAHIRSLTHPDSLISKSHRVECKRTHSVASHSHKQIRGHTHEPPILTNRGMEGTLTHSLTDLPLEGVGGQIGDHTHSNSLSHTD